jgi:hypothetical protein
MADKFPITNQPEDIKDVLARLPTISVPESPVNTAFFRKLGFSVASSKKLLEILSSLGFIDDQNQASETWRTFVDSEKRGQVLATTIKSAYHGLFNDMLCPYLEDDDTLTDYFQMNKKLGPEEIGSIISTFHTLCEAADFQEILSENEIPLPKSPSPSVKVDPNLQLNIQIHIDPATPDEKIAVIFKNMRKYLIEKENT